MIFSTFRIPIFTFRIVYELVVVKSSVFLFLWHLQDHMVELFLIFFSSKVKETPMCDG